VLDAAGNLAEDFAPRPGGFIDARAHTVLGEAVQLLERIADTPGGLLQAIAEGTFGITKRPPDRGRGLDGVYRKCPDHYDPALELLGATEKEPAGV
jgi:beta-lysine 5,6-aminomutase alpha subunit